MNIVKEYCDRMALKLYVIKRCVKGEKTKNNLKNITDTSHFCPYCSQPIFSFFDSIRKRKEKQYTKNNINEERKQQDKIQETHILNHKKG